MSEFNSGYLQRKHFIAELKNHLEQHSRVPVREGENQGYEIGKHLGYSDALRDVIKMVQQLPEEPKKEPSRPLHLTQDEWDRRRSRR